MDRLSQDVGPRMRIGIGSKSFGLRFHRAFFRSGWPAAANEFSPRATVEVWMQRIGWGKSVLAVDHPATRLARQLIRRRGKNCAPAGSSWLRDPGLCHPLPAASWHLGRRPNAPRPGCVQSNTRARRSRMQLPCTLTRHCAHHPLILILIHKDIQHTAQDSSIRRTTGQDSASHLDSPLRLRSYRQRKATRHISTITLRFGSIHASRRG